MNLVVPQQVKDRFAQVEAQVRGQIVALERLAGANLSGAREKLDGLPAQITAELAVFWPKLRERLQLLLDIAPKSELVLLQSRVAELELELQKAAAARLDVAVAPAPVVVAEAVEIVAEPQVEPVVEVEAAAVEAAPAPAPQKNGNGKKNGQRRR